MTKDTEALREALTAHYPTGEWMQPWGNHVLCCSCGENLWGVDRDACKAAWRTHVIEALATPASDELGFDPTAEVGDEVFPHDERNDSYKYGDKVRIVPGPPDLPEAPATSRKIVDGVDLGPVSQPYPGADDLILAPCSCGFCGNPTPVDPVAGGEALREIASIIDPIAFSEAYIGNRGLFDGGALAERRKQRRDVALGKAVRILAALKGPAA